MNWGIFRRKLYISWQVAIVCVGIFAGIWWAQYVRVPQVFLPIGLLVAVVCVGFAVYKKFVYLIPLLVIGGVLTGLTRGLVLQEGLSQLKPLYGQIVTVEGLVKDDVDTDPSDKIVIRLGDMIIKDISMSGAMWVSASTTRDIKRGDKLIISGQLSEGFGSFAGVMYRADVKEGIQPVPGDIARVARDWFADGVRQSIPEPESSLGIGYLVGQRRSLPADLAQSLQIAGLTHIVVASGYNLTILVRLARRLFEKISKYLSALSASVMIFVFIAITGVSPSMSRAGLVAGLSLAAWYYGRRFHPIILLLFAIAVTVLVNPSYAWGDLGWQLSFAAFGGVMIVAPLMQRYLFGDGKPGIIRQILGETVSAQIATAPILVYAFGQLSNVAIVANIMILPLVPLAMLLTFIAGVGGLALPVAAEVIGLPATWLLQYMVGVAEYMADLPWAMNTFEIPVFGIVIYYLVLAAFCVYLWRATGFSLREVNIVE